MSFLRILTGRSSAVTAFMPQIHPRKVPYFVSNFRFQSDVDGSIFIGARRSTASWKAGSLLPISGTKSRARTTSSASAINHDPTVEECPSPVFQVKAPYEPVGDQPKAIADVVQQLKDGARFSILQGCTGTGKTFCMAHILAQFGRPSLVLCHNKTLAAQLARELRSFLPDHAVELFVSYYNYYMPESFVETTGKYIEKKTSVNDEIDALRHRATRALLQRKDCVVVASVSCIYGLGLPKEYLDASIHFAKGEVISLREGQKEELYGSDDASPLDENGDSPWSSAEDFVVQQIQSRMLYTRPENGEDLERGNYQLLISLESPRVSVLSLWPPHEKLPYRLELLETDNGIIVNKIQTKHVGKEGLHNLDSLHLFPAKHHVLYEDSLSDVCASIEDELREQLHVLNAAGKVVEAQRLNQRVSADLQMLRETGYCQGIENYSRHLSGKAPGEPPDTLMDYLRVAASDGNENGEWLLLVDESHVTLPQLKAMYAGDQSRKRRLVNHGFRLPSALDNRPLKNDEFWERVERCLFVSATPSRDELARTNHPPVEMIIRPTHVCDPTIEVRPKKNQLNDLMHEIENRANKNERTLALALTKRDAEDLSAFLQKNSIPSAYIHSSMNTQERADAIKQLQNGEVNCLVGINLLREGLDLPQVSLVAILHADAKGFLRSHTALIQSLGRAARHENGTAIFYADEETDAMKEAITKTHSRRTRQMAYNRENGKQPKTASGSAIVSIFDLLRDEIKASQPLQIVGTNTSNREPIPDRHFHLPIESAEKDDLVTDHIPSKPGVYFWNDGEGNVLYIGKAKDLRRRVGSYLSRNAKHSARIQKMLDKATSVDFVMTPSERDALILENNSIKFHQPPYNVMLKDDQSYPYICASIGDQFPRFYAVPRRDHLGAGSSKYRYFGPYPHWNEIHSVLDKIEEKYDLRGKSFAARHGEGSQRDYNTAFQTALLDVFEGPSAEEIPVLRHTYEEANLLFENEYNKCRDVVAVACSGNRNDGVLVHLVQLREGLVAGRFSYSCDLPSTFETTDDDLAAIVETVLEHQHYSVGGESTGSFPFFPDELLMQVIPTNKTDFTAGIRRARRSSDPDCKGTLTVRRVARGGKRKLTDERVMEFASDNAQQILSERALDSDADATRTSLDGTAAEELALMLDLEEPPSKIECYDISNLQGEDAVGSRVVFVNGRPERSLYRKFNIKTVDGIDDYASLSEVLQRRFQRAWVNGKGGTVDSGSPWAIPDLVVIDGGVGQLGAAIKGMRKANVFPLEPFNPPEEVDYDIDPDGSFQQDAEQIMPERSTSVAICSLAKNQEEVFGVGRSGALNSLPDSPALLLLRSLRDESHRFALASHRNRRTKRVLRP